jgi:ABC-type transporter Mla subunit MlaD
MKTSSAFQLGLRWAAALVLIGALGGWLATGAHVGWSQTSTVTMQHDEVTGIDYPVRRETLVAGVEVLGAGLAVALTLIGASFVRLGRRATVVAA